jgi:polysaccharide pyruvyl transferase WcaK-like protein
MPDGLKILLAGVPFGCDNVGDEAILECAVRIVRQACPECHITVSTNDGPATARKLQVETCELFGFLIPYREERMIEALRTHDVFIWCGATGLSDYPEVPLNMLRIAQAARKKTVLWGVGMNTELNPAWYRVREGQRRKALSLLTALTLGWLDVVAFEERRRQRRARRRIARYVNAADLVVVRDPESRDEVLRCGVDREVVVGADSALLLQPSSLGEVVLPATVRDVLYSEAKKVGICISAQRAVQDEGKLMAYLDQLVVDGSRKIVFIPMNPVTDAELMARLRSAMAHPERAVVLEGRHEPRDLLAVVSALDLVVSSRLHLLFFASIMGVPIIGISRGSKIDNFLGSLGLQPVGQVDDWDYDLLLAETGRLLAHKEAFVIRNARVKEELLARLNKAQRRLKEILIPEFEIPK